MISLLWIHRRSGRSSSLMLVHCLLYVPTISITNSIAFAQHEGRAEGVRHRPHGRHDRLDHGGVAVHVHPRRLGQGARARETTGFVDWLGTVLASGLTGPALQQGTRYMFVVAGVASLVLAAFSLTLPHTPPKKVAAGGEQVRVARGDAAAQAPVHPGPVPGHVHRRGGPQLLLQLDGHVPRHAGGGWRRRHPGNWIMPVMSIGQIAEILTMVVLGVTLKRLGWRTTMILGILGHAARFAVFAFFPENQALDHPDQRRARHLLRVLLRDRLHLRGRVLPEGRARERAGALQPADPRPRAARRERRRSEADGRDVQDGDGRRLQEPVPGAVRRRRAGGDHPGGLLPPAASEGTRRRH